MTVDTQNIDKNDFLKGLDATLFLADPFQYKVSQLNYDRIAEMYTQNPEALYHLIQTSCNNTRLSDSPVLEDLRLYANCVKQQMVPFSYAAEHDETPIEFE